MFFFVARFVVFAYLGADWIGFKVKISKHEGEWLRPQLRDADEFELYMMRIMLLAELLYNCQDVSGFEVVVKKFTDDIRGKQIADHVAVLTFAKLLKLNGIQFRFVPEVGKKGSDFDIEIEFQKTKMFCEVKNKDEFQDYTADGLKNGLKRAYKQLPKDGFGIVAISCPPHYISNPNWVKTLHEVSQWFFWQSKRIGKIIWYTETYFDESGEVEIFDLIVEEKSPRPEWEAYSNVRLLGPLNEGSPRKWLNIIARAFGSSPGYKNGFLSFEPDPQDLRVPND